MIPKSLMIYFAVIQNQMLANLGLVLTMVIVAIVLYRKNALGTFADYFYEEGKKNPSGLFAMSFREEAKV
jgi:hypothetical protein